MVRYIVLLAAAIAAYAQGSTPKASPADYPVQAKIGATPIGADFMVHSFSAGEEMFIAEKYLVVEVAFYPPKGEKVAVATSDFTLTVNGKKPLAAQNPAMVASSLKHRDGFLRGPLGNLGVGGINVGGGQPRTTSPYPGGPDQNRLPNPPRAPDGDSNTPTRETPKAEDILLKTALPEGTHSKPVSGFIFFPWTGGKVSSIKSLDLNYNGVVIKLR